MKTKYSIFFTACIALMATINSASAQTDVNATRKLDKVTYKIADEKIRVTVEKENTNTELKAGQILNKPAFEKERERLAQLIRKNVDPTFDKKQIRFLVDTTQVKDLFSVEIVISKSN